MGTAIESLTRKIVSENPATGAILHESECASEADVRGAVERARAAQLGWNALGVESRVAILKKFQRLLFDRKTEVARAISREAGKPYVDRSAGGARFGAFCDRERVSVSAR